MSVIKKPRNMSVIKKPRYLVYKCSDQFTHYSHFGKCGGLGDRIQGIISGAAAAKNTNRQFIIDSPLTTANLNPSNINWKQPLPPECFAGAVTLQELNLMDKWEPTTLFAAANSSIRCLSVRINQNFYGRTIAKALLAELFQPPTLRFPGLILNASYMSIHIRMGGNGDFGFLETYEPPRYTWLDIKRFIAPALKWKGSVFLASDSLVVKGYVKAFLPSVLFNSNKAIHIDKEFVSEKKMTETWQTLFTLSQAKCMIYGWSGFAFIAQDWPGSKFESNCSFMI